MFNRNFFLALITLHLVSGCVHNPIKGRKNMHGTAIILNGPSASGKSSIQKEFQHLMMPDLWLKVGIDNLFDSPMPDITPENLSYWQEENPIRWVSRYKNKDNKNIVTLHVGSLGEKTVIAMNNAIAAYLESGCNIIVDYISYKKEWFNNLRSKLSPYKTIYVGVDISLEELEKREASRKSSPVGHARSHYELVHADKNYDLRVNTEKNSTKEIAQEIINFIKLEKK